MELLIEEKRVAWPQNQVVIRYDTMEKLVDAIREGTAPRNLRIYERLDEFTQTASKSTNHLRIIANIEQLNFWVGKNIGYGKPRYKRFIRDIKKSSKPLSTWVLPSSMKKADLEAIDLNDVTAFEVGFTSEGTTLLTQMISNKDFPYPKPMSLIQSLVQQATDAESSHIVLDFFAGSGTTGHAVLSLNEQDDGNRIFVLIASSEATQQQPAKNICRDITAKRLRAAIDGYSYRTSKGSKKINGLSGEFAYMRTTRVPRESLAIDIRHDQIWFALQQMHANAVSPFQKSHPVQALIGDEAGHDILYVPQLNKEAFDVLHERIEGSRKPCVIYSWQPGLIGQQFDNDHIEIQKIPDYLIERFGGIGQ